ncbi:hypothetical protein ANN_00622 [Periplaneta americana]|uniref:Uncharacterized protein n=1 Tax=Periplaneta americana TaxID=6978 RepID=A0ABQ8TU79_PERAM|nr:hypothetical protein ANN_00622 [Periplaneta americana]
MVEKVQKYYGKAIRNNKDPAEMKNAIYAILDHYRSTDENPQHKKCPIGEDSWCIFNRDAARNVPPPLHKDKIKTPLSDFVVAKMMPVFQRLASDDLLMRCKEGKTQNANECLHSVIWSKCPKTTMVTRKRIELAVIEGITQFNSGNSLHNVK